MKKFLSSGILLFFFTFPASDNYMLRSYGFGSGGMKGAESDNYSLEGITGQMDAGYKEGGNYDLGSGLMFVQQAHVPLSCTLTNPDEYYNKLYFAIDPSNNPADAKFGVEVSIDNFVTIKYLQNDMTLGDTMGNEDYQKLADWNAGGNYILGLDPDTTYQVRLKATQGKYTESRYGPIAQAATAEPKLTFDIDVSDTDQETDAPFSVDLGELSGNSVTTSQQKIWVDFATNADFGGTVYIAGKNTGLASSLANYKIPAMTNNLDSINEGFGVQGFSVSQTAGGPFSFFSPYDLADNQVGIVDPFARDLCKSDTSLKNGRAAFVLKAKITNATPAADDYQDQITLVAAANF